MPHLAEHYVMMILSRPAILLTAIIVVPLLVSAALAQTTAEPGQPTTQPPVSEKDDLYARDMKTCMDSWDSFTQMTKAEWKQTCERTLKEKYYRPLDELKDQ